MTGPPAEIARVTLANLRILQIQLAGLPLVQALAEVRVSAQPLVLVSRMAAAAILLALAVAVC